MKVSIRHSHSSQAASLIPGLVPLLLTLGCMRLLKKNVSPIVIILALFIIGILGHIIGLL